MSYRGYLSRARLILAGGISDVALARELEAAATEKTSEETAENRRKPDLSNLIREVARGGRD